MKETTGKHASWPAAGSMTDQSKKISSVTKISEKHFLALGRDVEIEKIFTQLNSISTLFFVIVWRLDMDMHLESDRKVLIVRVFICCRYLMYSVK